MSLPFFLRPLAALGVLSTIAVVGIASPAGAVTTLHFYSVSQQNIAYDPSGKPITSANTAAVVGDQFESIHLDFVGTHQHHARTFSASDHLVCVLTGLTESGGVGVCDGQIAIGGSLLLAEHSPVTFSSSGSLSPITLNAGTGRFEGAQGTVSSQGIAKSANADLTITLSKL